MTIDALREALDELAEPACCEGTYRLTERLAIALPDGDVAAVDDPTFVDWLNEHAEDAPFGKGGKTVVDKDVRHARRLVARGAATIAGFDPASVLGQIEAELSPREHLVAELTDVLMYPAGGRFARHKDTPRGPDLIGTLVVGLPIAHEGGVFEVVEPDGICDINWGGACDPSLLRWVALFSDADHEIEEVTSGTRVTLVYALSRSQRRRVDPARDAKLAKVKTAVARLALPTEGPLMIACTRHVITTDEVVVQGADVLRGMDRDLAQLLVEAGFSVAVRSCIAAVDSDDQNEERMGLPVGDYAPIARLAHPIPRKVLRNLDETVTFADEASYDGEGMDASNLGPYILDSPPLDQWLIRRSARGTLIHEAEYFSEDGYFGNEGYAAHLYTLAALEVTPTN